MDFNELKKPFIIAEMSGNHNQSLDRAMRIVEAAKEAGADAVKLQTYTADTMTIDKRDGEFFINDKKSLWYGKSLYELYKQAYTPWDWQEKIFARCKELGIVCFSTPFDATAVDFLEGLNCPIYKIASFENIDLPLVRKIAKTGKPIIASTGMATFAEIDDLVRVAGENGCRELTLLKCTSNYPATPAGSNLLTIQDMKKHFQCDVGISDHTLGIGVAVAAVALGASVIEKHFTLSRSDGGVDAAFSLEPSEMKQLVRECNAAKAALGTIAYGMTQQEEKSRKFRRSLYVVKDMKIGDVFTEENIRSIRPEGGLSPKFFDEVLGRKAQVDIVKGTPLSNELFKRVRGRDAYITEDELIHTIYINSVKELRESVIYNDKFAGYVYRGHSRESYLLKPTFLRGNLFKKYKKQKELCIDELKLLLNFFRCANDHGLVVPDLPIFFRDYMSQRFDLSLVVNNDDYRWLGDKCLELAILAQHYGIRTRLLDWTRDFRTALYFACAGKKANDSENGAVWCIDAEWLQVIKRKNVDRSEELATCISNMNMDNHDEKYRLLSQMQDDSIPLSFHVSPYYSNQNLNAQKGVLSIWRHNLVKNTTLTIDTDLRRIREDIANSLEKFFESEISDDNKQLNDLLLNYFNQNAIHINTYRQRKKDMSLLCKIIIPSKVKHEVMELLRIDGYDYAKIYPGYKSVAKMIDG